MSERDCNNWLFLSKNITPPENQVAATFRLSLADLAKLRKWVLERETAPALVQVPPPLLMLQQQHPSRFELACAYTWICLNKARKKHHDQHGRESNEGEIVPIIFNIDYRGRSDPPVPANYFGNYVVSVRVTAKKSEIVGENGLIFAVRAVRNGIRSGINTDWIVKNSGEKISRLISNGPERFPTIAGSTQFGFYKLDFGWGKPNKVDLVSIATTGAIFFADTRSEDGGIEISLARSKDEIEAFAVAFTNDLNNLS